jgi:hypothetical protein
MDEAKQGSDYLAKYADATEMFNKNELSEKHAFKMLAKQEERIMILHQNKGIPASENDFLLAATNTVIEIRQVLKWMYAYPL